MGQDIHWKMYGKSCVEDRYVDLEEFGVDTSLYTGRSYDMFSCFGSGRSDYPHLDNLEFGMPDCLPPTTKKFFEMDRDFHTMSWWNIQTLKHSLERYVEKLKNPGLFMLDEGFKEEYFGLKEFEESYDAESRDGVVAQIKEILQRLDYAISDMKTWCSDIIDINNVIVLVYFDN